MTLIIALNYSCLFAFIFREQKLEMLLPWESVRALWSRTGARPAGGLRGRSPLPPPPPVASRPRAVRAVCFLVLRDTNASVDPRPLGCF